MQESVSGKYRTTRTNSKALFSHLIADHLSWFTQSSDEPKTVEEIVAAHGGRIRRGVQYTGQEDGGKQYETMEILSDTDEAKE